MYLVMTLVNESSIPSESFLCQAELEKAGHCQEKWNTEDSSFCVDGIGIVHNRRNYSYTDLLHLAPYKYDLLSW